METESSVAIRRELREYALERITLAREKNKSLKGLFKTLIEQAAGFTITKKKEGGGNGSRSRGDLQQHPRPLEMKKEKRKGGGVRFEGLAYPKRRFAGAYRIKGLLRPEGIGERGGQKT